jgi:hypothetical protein
MNAWERKCASAVYIYVFNNSKWVALSVVITCSNYFCSLEAEAMNFPHSSLDSPGYGNYGGSLQ